MFGQGRLSPEAVDFIKWRPLIDASSREQKLAALVVTGSPFDIWSGPVDMAFGLEWREDEAHFESDPIMFSGDVMGIRGSLPVDGTEKVTEVFTEGVMTLFDSAESDMKLDLELGAKPETGPPQRAISTVTAAHTQTPPC